LRAIGSVSERRGRAIDAVARIVTVSGGDLVAEASARFIRVSADQAREWREAYGAGDDDSMFGEAIARGSALD
jgi:hypothetical protein